MTYKEIAYTLCGGFFDNPAGCDCCPLAYTTELDDEGNGECILRRMIANEELAEVEQRNGI